MVSPKEYTLPHNKYLIQYVLEHVTRYIEYQEGAIRDRGLRRNQDLRQLKRHGLADVLRNIVERAPDILEDAPSPPDMVYHLLPVCPRSQLQIRSALQDVCVEAQLVADQIVDSPSKDEVRNLFELEAIHDGLIEKSLAPYRLLQLHAWELLEKSDCDVGHVSDAPEAGSGDHEPATGITVHPERTDRADPFLGLVVDEEAGTVRRSGETTVVELSRAEWFIFRLHWRAGATSFTTRELTAAYDRKGSPDYDGRQAAKSRANGKLKGIGIRMENRCLNDTRSSNSDTTVTKIA